MVLLFVMENVSGKLFVLNIVIGLSVMWCMCRFECGSGLCFGRVELRCVFIVLLVCIMFVNRCSWLYVWLCLFFRCGCGSVDLVIVCLISVLFSVLIWLVMVFRKVVWVFGVVLW